MSDQTAGKREPQARSKLRREVIAQAVLDIVDEVGHEGVTTALVASRSRTSEATVLYHFPTKDHLLVAALERADTLTAEQAGVDVAEQKFDLDAFVASPHESVARQRLAIMLRGQAATPSHPAAEFFQRRSTQIIEIFARIIRQRQHDGLAHPGMNAEDTARLVLSLLEGLGTLSMLNLDFDQAAALKEGFRRVTGQNWMETRDRVFDKDAGL